ncbi:MAG: sugar ABC transporter permease, partial [Candidatus Bathyarchaeota archaeon]|nr:sugar ABC transporter permease [Candidatus Bathyarchaeota archaeon]
MRLPSRTMLTKDRIVTLILFLPSLVLVGYFVYVTIGWNVVVSLSDWKGLTPSYNIVGFDQYTRLFQDPTFFTALKNNLVLILLFVPGSLFLGLFLAILLDLKVRGEGVFRGIYLLPFALSFVVTAVLWAWMYNPSIGVINTLLMKTGLGFLKSGWITDPNVGLYCVVLAIIWQFSGYTMLIFLAGIRSIPESQMMAAEVDGASGFDLYRLVVIPQLKAPALSAFVVLMVFALKAFDFIFVLTDYSDYTYILPLMMFRETFSMNRFSYG